MRRLAKISAAISMCGIGVVLILAAVAPHHAVLVSISPDPTMIRSRNYCVMNPFRDQAPEKAANRFLAALRSGDRSVLAVVRDPGSRAHFSEREAQWPVTRWRIASRNDKPDVTELVY